MIEYDKTRNVFYQATQAGFYKKGLPEYHTKFAPFHLRLLTLLKEREMLKDLRVSLKGIVIQFYTSTHEVKCYFFTYDYLEIYLENPVEFFNKEILRI